MKKLTKETIDSFKSIWFSQISKDEDDVPCVVTYDIWHLVKCYLIDAKLPLNELLKFLENGTNTPINSFTYSDNLEEVLERKKKTIDEFKDKYITVEELVEKYS